MSDSSSSSAFPGCVVVDEASLSVDDLALACAVEPQWVVEHVEAGLIGDAGDFVHVSRTTWRFAGRHLLRARQIAALERDMDANPELAALVVDLTEALQRLKLRLRAAGLAGARG